MIKYILVFVLLFAVCPPGFAEDTDCQNAAASCEAQCDQAPVQSMFWGDQRHEKVFLKECKDSCANGLHNCQLQDSYNACDTFYFHCAESCPWTISDNFDTTTPPPDANNFSQCVKACGEGGKSCQAAPSSSRKRTAAFDACVEAQEACYSDCGNEPWDTEELGPIAGSDYPNKCSKACFTGLAPCQAISTPGKKCQEFFRYCDKACPDTVTDEWGNEHLIDDSAMGCHDTCEKGKDYCNNILH
jgi:hypothetical protein